MAVAGKALFEVAAHAHVAVTNGCQALIKADIPFIESTGGKLPRMNVKYSFIHILLL